MFFIDSHAHITSKEFLSDSQEVIERAWQKGVRAIINICISLEEIEKGMQLLKNYPWIYLASAVHPHDTVEASEPFFQEIASYARKKHLVAIGETGLDYFYKNAPPESQKNYLRRHFQLALECNLPVIIHCREAFADFFEVLDAEYVVEGRYGPGVLHCFTGTAYDAEEVLKRGWYISFSGIITFKKSVELQEIVKLVPLDRILVETDAPFLAPQARRGKRNESSFVPEIAEKIAFLKGISIEEVAHATTENAKKLFNLRQP